MYLLLVSENHQVDGLIFIPLFLNQHSLRERMLCYQVLFQYIFSLPIFFQSSLTYLDNLIVNKVNAGFL